MLPVNARKDSNGRTVITVGPDELWDHVVGDTSCTSGWCGTGDYPKGCEQPGCEGIVHADFGDESSSGFWLHTKCDICGEGE